MDQSFAPPPEQKKSNRTLIIVIVVLVVLCCCCVAGVGGWYLYTYGDQMLNLTSSPSFYKLIS